MGEQAQGPVEFRVFLERFELPSEVLERLDIAIRKSVVGSLWDAGIKEQLQIRILEEAKGTRGMEIRGF